MRAIDALGSLETTSIARGIEATDLMLKRAAVELVISRVICPGKYLAVLTGPVEDVKNALEAGVTAAGDSLADSLYLTNPDRRIFPALAQTTELKGIDALGIVETYSLCSAIEAADRAAKQAMVDLLEIRLSVMLAGKSFVTFTGSHAAVRAAVEAAAAAAREKGLLVCSVVIPRPRSELNLFLL
jgi:microcompartment protein CcmL/EutN